MTKDAPRQSGGGGGRPGTGAPRAGVAPLLFSRLECPPAAEKRRGRPAARPCPVPRPAAAAAVAGPRAAPPRRGQSGQAASARWPVLHFMFASSGVAGSATRQRDGDAPAPLPALSPAYRGEGECRSRRVLHAPRTRNPNGRGSCLGAVLRQDLPWDVLGHPRACEVVRAESPRHVLRPTVLSPRSGNLRSPRSPTALRDRV